MLSREAMEEFEKTTAESYVRAFEWYGRTPPGSTKPTGVQSVSATEWDKATQTAGPDAPNVVGPDSNVDGTLTYYRVQNGDVGKTYRITVGVNFDGGQFLEERIVMMVKA